MCHSGDNGNGTRGSVSQTGWHIPREASISLLSSTLCPCQKLVSRDPSCPWEWSRYPSSQEPALTAGREDGQCIFNHSRFSSIKDWSSLDLGSVVSAGEGGMTLDEPWG